MSTSGEAAAGSGALLTRLCTAAGHGPPQEPVTGLLASEPVTQGGGASCNLD
jgi:hypothetical protein